MSTRTWLSSDYYETLGVAPDASDGEITRVFRARAKLLHPDRATDTEASTRFREITAAYDVLGNPTRRARYDATRRHPERAEVVRAEPPSPVVTDAHRPVSVRFLADRRKAGWALGAGIVLVVAGIVAAGLVLLLQASDRADRQGTVSATAARIRRSGRAVVRFRTTTGRTVIAPDPDPGSGEGPGSQVAIRYRRDAPSHVTTDDDTLPRDVTFWLVATKLVVVGAVFAGLGARRRRYP